MSSVAFEAPCVDTAAAVTHDFRMAKGPRPTFIKQWRIFRGLSQEALAERTGMSNGNISLIERGRQNYTQETLERIADALQCEPADLLARSPGDTEDLWQIFRQAKPV